MSLRDDQALNGSGLYRFEHPDGSSVTKLAGHNEHPERPPGSASIGIGGVLLLIIGLGALVVSITAQYQYLLPARRGEFVPAAIEAGLLDAGMLVFSLLAFGLARAGKTARIERVLIVACAAASAAMNFGAADLGSPRSIAAYMVAPMFLAVVIDRLVAVVYRHVRTEPPRSAWRDMAHRGGLGLLYLVRLVIAPWSTLKGARRAVLEATPLPGIELKPVKMTVTAEVFPSGAEETPAIGQPKALPRPRRSRPRRGESKYAHFARLYAEHPDAGDPSKASFIASELAPRVGLASPGTARNYAKRYLLDSAPAGSDSNEEENT